MDLEQPEFWNAAVSGFWSGSPEELLSYVLSLENQAGRVRNPDRPKGPRILDIDILLFGDLVMETVRLTVPHPEMARRLFVLSPLLELAPDLVDPRNGLPLENARSEVSDQGVYLTSESW